MSQTLIEQFKSPHTRLKSVQFVKDLEAHPEWAIEVDLETGNTALHFACCGVAPVGVVKVLLKANPDAAKLKDLDGNLPIMGAVANGCDSSVVVALLKSFPKGIQARSGPHTLLHQAACQAAYNNDAAKTVEVLIEAWPEASMETDAEGNTPLHFAAACNADIKVVRLLLAAYPKAAAMRGRLDRLPLSLALLCQAPPEVIGELRDAYPDALRDETITADYLNMGFGVNKPEE